MFSNDIMLEFIRQSSTGFYCLWWDISVRWEIGEEEDGGECIVKITDCVCEGWVPFFDDVIELYTGFVEIFETFGIGEVAAAEGFREFFAEGFVLTEFLEDRLVEKVLNVLGVVEGYWGSRTLVGFLLVTGLSWVDSLKDAKPPKIR